MGQKSKKTLSRNWWTLVHIFWHFWKALGQAYMTEKICGPKFKNGGDVAMGAKTGKPPLLKKSEIFRSKIRLILEENICVQKDYFRETKKLGVGLTSPAQNSVPDQQSMPSTSGQNLVHIPSIAFWLDKKSGLSECQVKACKFSSSRSTMTLLSHLDGFWCDSNL